MKRRLAYLIGVAAAAASISACSAHVAVPGSNGSSNTLAAVTIAATMAPTFSAAPTTVGSATTSSPTTVTNPTAVTKTVATATAVTTAVATVTVPPPAPKPTPTPTVHVTATVTSTVHTTVKVTAPVTNPAVVASTVAIPSSVDYPSAVEWCTRTGSDPQFGGYTLVVHNGHNVAAITDLDDSMISFWAPDTAGLRMRTNVVGGSITGGAKPSYDPFQWVQGLQPGDTTLQQWKEFWPHEAGNTSDQYSFQTLERGVSQATQQTALDLAGQIQTYYGHVNDSPCN